MKLLITGVAGFIGFHLANKFAQEGIDVVGIDNINDYYDVNLKYARLTEAGIDRSQIGELKKVESSRFEKYSFYKMDLTDLSSLQELFKRNKFTHVINLAAQAGVRYSIENPHSYVQSNLVGFMNILECCRYNKIEHLIYASSSSVYGMNVKIPFAEEDRVDNPVSLYAATKKSNELMAHTYSHLYDLKTTGLRFFTVYGPWGRPDMAPMLFADAICKGEPIKVFNNGEMERDFTYIDDIVESIYRLVFNEKKIESNYSIFNIGNSKPIKLMDFIETLENELGTKSEKNLMPMQEGDVVKTWADVNKLINIIDYKPSGNLTKGIEAFVEWKINYDRKI